MSRAYSEDEARKRADEELERLNKSREWLKNYHAMLDAQAVAASPTREAAE